MTGRGTLLPAALVAALVGLGPSACGPAPPPEPEPTRTVTEVPTPAEELLGRGAAAGTTGEYGAAVRHLAELRRRCGSSPLGNRALLVWAALELDPRNSLGRPARGSAAAATYLASATAPPWATTVAASLYLLALEVGGSAVRPGAADSPPLPPLSVPAGEPPGATEMVLDEATLRRLLLERPLVGSAADTDGCDGLPLSRAGAPPTGGVDTLAAGRGDSIATPIPRLPHPPLASRLAELRRTADSLRVLTDSLQAEVKRLRELIKGSSPP